MVPEIRRASLFLSLILLFFVACVKEYSIEGLTKNLAPNASAGTDTTFYSSGTYPVTIEPFPSDCLTRKDTLRLDASLSSDPDGEILSYQWRFINNHPANTGADPLILNADYAIASVILGIPGEYWFSVKVTDNSGGTDLDSIKVIQAADPGNNASFKEIKPDKLGILNTSAISKVVTAGNLVIVQYQVDSFVTNNNGYTLTPDKFKAWNIDSKTWTDLYLPQYRSNINLVSTGNKVVFSGGWINLETAINPYYEKVEILDIGTGNISFVDLPPSFIVSNSIAVGDKILFTGNDANDPYRPSDRIEILDLVTHTWHSSNMSQARNLPNLVAATDEVIIAGGMKSNAGPNVIDIVNLQTNTWRTSSMAPGPHGTSGVAFDGKVYWFGGYYYGEFYNDAWVHQVEAWDIKSGASEFICLGEGLITGHIVNNQLVLTRNFSDLINDTMYFYSIQLYKLDPVTKEWTFGHIKESNRPIGGIGTIFGPPNQEKIFGIGAKEYPNVFWDYSMLYPLFDHEFWEIEF